MLQLAKKAGKQVMKLWENGITPRKIITDESIRNAVRVCMAVGGSSNTIIHIPAVATEAGLSIECSPVYADASREIPTLIGIRPNGDKCMADLDIAGGVPALLNELRGLLDLNGITVTGRTLGENIEGKAAKDHDVIHTMQNPYKHDGGLILCKGNLVPEGAFIKQSAVPDKLRRFRGKARVFYNKDDAIRALYNGEIQAGDAVFILYQGVKAGPNSAYAFATALKGSHLKDDVCAITDGRLSGAAAGAVFGYASPEAALRGPLCAVKDGDWINYDIDKRELNIELSDEILKKRMEEAELRLQPKTGWLSIYQRCVGSVLKGATLVENVSPNNRK